MVYIIADLSPMHHQEALELSTTGPLQLEVLLSKWISDVQFQSCLNMVVGLWSKITAIALD